MTQLIKLGYATTAMAWLAMIYNLAYPFAGLMGMALTILLLVTVIMHALQIVIFHQMFKDRLSLTIKDYLMVCVFGLFGLLAYRQKIIQRTLL
ncbi:MULTISPECIES: DUF1145 domain-containing protein [Pseudomonadati]|uniref:DUF1145 domain-containing protein n=1 Tax=Shewanella aestuarii TaxID=1028752 RepID=A0ABT0L6F3_9GAMM|nr:DUF1145 domain-containing protein [Shewanella aestuarii]MCL1118786.1 DUF1145 domain-containing protein [Shewanella aestuarii]GGN79942.1 hypothetical protein GCM10009193_24520 [Shewanella aestuarii]